MFIKVEVYITGPVVKNSKGKVKQFNLEAGQIGIIDMNKKVLYNALVYHKKGSFRVNPHSKNGFKADSLDKSDAKSIQTVREDLKTIFKDKLIIGCALAGDFDSFGIPFGEYSQDAFDLQWHYYDTYFSPLGRDIVERWSLKKMCQLLIGVEMHEKGTIHTAVEDAMFTMKVFEEGYMKILPEPITKVQCNF